MGVFWRQSPHHQGVAIDRIFHPDRCTDRKQQRKRNQQERRRRLQLESLEKRALLAIDVAVVGTSGSQDGFNAIVSQLNDDTYFDFNAVLVDPTDVDTVAELKNYGRRG